MLVFTPHRRIRAWHTWCRHRKVGMLGNRAPPIIATNRMARPNAGYGVHVPLSPGAHPGRQRVRARNTAKCHEETSASCAHCATVSRSSTTTYTANKRGNGMMFLVVAPRLPESSTSAAKVGLFCVAARHYAMKCASNKKMLIIARACMQKSQSIVIKVLLIELSAWHKSRVNNKQQPDAN